MRTFRSDILTVARVRSNTGVPFKMERPSASLIDDRPHRGFRRNRARSRSIPPRSHGDAQCEQAQDRAVRGELLVGTGGHARSGALIGELAGQSQARADGRRVWYRFSPPDRALEGLWRRHRLPGRHARDHHLGTVHAPLFHPIIAAKAMVTADHISEGRFGLNIVVGWNEGEFAMFGVQQRDHDARYEYAQEWIDVIKMVWSDKEDFDFEGKYLDMKGVRGKPKPYGGSRPLIMNAGASPVGQAFAIRNCDAFFLQASRT